MAPGLRSPCSSLRLKGRWIVALAALLLAMPLLAEQSVPALSGRVVDLTGVLAASDKAELEQRLEAIEDKEGAQVAILLVPTTQPEAIEQYSMRVAEAWQLGRGEVDGKPVDDGVLLLAALDDRKVRIEVGYGLEGAIPDARAKRIIEERIVPRFRDNDFAGGLRAAVTAIAALIEGEPLPPPRKPDPGSAGGGSWVGPIFMGFVVGLLATGVVGRALGSALGSGASGLLAALAGLALFGIIGSALMTLLMLSVLGGGGGSGLRRVGRHTWRSGPPFILPGGFDRGGGFGGGLGGGFGGGGGGFGGGGASGGW
jgi:uncharacterized protein